jgi:protein-disulfide isomerase
MLRAARFAPVLVALAALALAGGARAESKASHHVPVAPGMPPPHAPTPRDTLGDIALGSAKAPVTVIEYASTTCPHCAAWDREVFPAFKRKYVDTGKVRYILRESPTDPEIWAEGAFVVARCAGPAKFYDVVEAFMAQQKVLYDQKDGVGWLARGGAVGGLSREQVQACLHDKAGVMAMKARVEANDKAFDVQGLPTFIVNGKIVGDGEVTLVELDKAIDRASAPPPALRGAQPPKRGAASHPRPKRKAD